tara:strand:+ start:152 stop:436 length:285 start_codon:yes stop_codon:yes gene_type:complete
MTELKAGRPSDKELYIDALLSHFNYSFRGNVEIKESLSKLNAKDLLLLNAYLCRTARVPLKELLEQIPKQTVAQSQRYNHVVDIYNGMEKSYDD